MILSPDVPVEHVATSSDGHHYLVVTIERDRVDVHGCEYTVDIDVDLPTTSDGEFPVHFRELPFRNRETMRSAIGNPGLIHAPHYTTFSVVFAPERDEFWDRSQFVLDTDVEYVEWEDAVLEMTFEERHPVEIASATVRTERIAKSLEGFVEDVGGERDVFLDELPGENGTSSLGRSRTGIPNMTRTLTRSPISSIAWRRTIDASPPSFGTTLSGISHEFPHEGFPAVTE